MIDVRKVESNKGLDIIIELNSGVLHFTRKAAKELAFKINACLKDLTEVKDGEMNPRPTNPRPCPPPPIKTRRMMK